MKPSARPESWRMLSLTLLLLLASLGMSGCTEKDGIGVCAGNQNKTVNATRQQCAAAGEIWTGENRCYCCGDDCRSDGSVVGP